jgi:hypothetical protein
MNSNLRFVTDDFSSIALPDIEPLARFFQITADNNNKYNNLESIREYDTEPRPTNIQNLFQYKCKCNNQTGIRPHHNLFMLDTDKLNFNTVIHVSFDNLNPLKQNIVRIKLVNITSDLSKYYKKLGKLGYFLQSLMYSLLDYNLVPQGGFIRDLLNGIINNLTESFDIDLFGPNKEKLFKLLFIFNKYEKKNLSNFTLTCVLLLDYIFKSYSIKDLSFQKYKISRLSSNSASMKFYLIDINGIKELKFDLNPDPTVNNCDFFGNSIRMTPDNKFCNASIENIDIVKKFTTDNLKHMVYNDDIVDKIMSFLDHKEIFLGIVLMQIINKVMEFCHICCSDQPFTIDEYTQIIKQINRMRKYHDRNFLITFNKCNKKNCASNILKKMYRYSLSNNGFILLRELYVNITKSYILVNPNTNKFIIHFERIDNKFKNASKYLTNSKENKSKYLTSSKEYIKTHYDKKLESKSKTSNKIRQKQKQKQKLEKEQKKKQKLEQEQDKKQKLEQEQKQKLKQTQKQKKQEQEQKLKQEQEQKQKLERGQKQKLEREQKQCLNKIKQTQKKIGLLNFLNIFY